MSKSIKVILVIDEPKDGCLSCPLYGAYEELCTKNENWCPLTRLPSFIKPDPNDTEWDEIYADGWNDCLNKMLDVSERYYG